MNRILYRLFGIVKKKDELHLSNELKIKSTIIPNDQSKWEWYNGGWSEIRWGNNTKKN